MMSCDGNPWLKTPAMDYLAAHGTRFTRVHTTNPVCVPARVGVMTGQFPGAFGIRDNDGGFKPTAAGKDYAQTNIAAQLKQAGYDLAYGGKTHLPKQLDHGNLGFEMIYKDREEGLAEACATCCSRNGISGGTRA